MKKQALTLLFFLLTTGISALPIGNPGEADLMREGLFMEGHCAHYCDPCTSWRDAWSVRLGFYGDYVWNRNMRVSRNDHAGNIRETQIWTNAGYLAVNFWDRLDIFATFGATSIEFESASSSLGSTASGNTRVTTETDFSWSSGMRATLYQWQCFTLGVEGQYFASRPDINTIQTIGDSIDYPDDGILKYRAWQLGAALSYRANLFGCSTAALPYIGVKWSRAHFDMDEVRETTGNLVTLFDLDNDRSFGYAVGLTLLGANKSSITAEARFLDEKALYINAQLRF